MIITAPSENKEASSYKPFSSEQLKEFVEVQTWLKNVSPGSMKVYLRALWRFCNWCKKSPHELIMQRDKELRIADPNKRTEIRNLLLDFRSHLEQIDLAPKTISSYDGALRGFFTSILGKRGMVNIRNYRDKSITRKKDLIPTIEELKKMLDTVNLEEKFRILFIAQTGMRVSDAASLKIGDIRRELELENTPLAIQFSPQKDRELIGERIAFLGGDGVEMLKQYLKWREKRGEILTDDSPLFVGRTKKRRRRKIICIAPAAFNETVREAAKKAGIGNGDGKYGTIRTHCLRKFFITQMTNHGMEDKIVNFLTCHKLSEVDCVYWNRRVDTLRQIYAERQQYVNPINGEKKHFDLKQFKGIIAKIKDLEEKISTLPTSEMVYEMILETIEKHGIVQDSSEIYKSEIVCTKEDVIRLSNLGFDCQPIGNSEWLMRKKQ